VIVSEADSQLARLLLTVSQAAQASGYSERMIQRLLAEGKIKGIKPGRDWLVTLEAVLEYKEKAKRGRPPKA
jgi:excisionase family DNA binding protein